MIKQQFIKKFIQLLKNNKINKSLKNKNKQQKAQLLYRKSLIVRCNNLNQVLNLFQYCRHNNKQLLQPLILKLKIRSVITLIT